MRKFNAILIAVLVVQIVLTVLMYNSYGQSNAAAAGPWLTLDQSKLGELVISDNQGHSVTLKHDKNGWTVPAKSGFPADKQRIQGLIGALNGVRPGLPVAVSRDAQKRFQVAKDKFQRHLLFKTAKGAVAADLYLGESAGSGRLYARLADKTDIEDLRIPLWRASTSASDWLDKGYLELTISQQKQVVLPKVTLTRTDNLWQPEGLSSDRLADQDHIQALLDRLRTLRWDALDGKRADVQLPAKATFAMTVTPKDGKPLVYHFYQQPQPAQSKDKDKSKNKAGKESAKPAWWVTRSDGDFVFTVSDERVAPLLQADKTSLSKAKPAKGKSQPDNAGGDKSANAGDPGKSAGPAGH